MSQHDAAIEQQTASIWEIFLVALRLGLTSFGGPIAHLGYFHNEYVRRRAWLDERSYADLVALCQFLPGPASSQVGIGVGVMRGGLLGGIAAFLGFTLPSVIALTIFAMLLQEFDVSGAGWVHGLKVVAVVVVAHAVLGMGQKLAAGKAKATIAVVAASVTLLWQTAYTQVLVIVIAGVLGWMLYKGTAAAEAPPSQIRIRRSFGAACLALFFGLLVILPLARGTGESVAIFDSYYRSGALVFGGGHVVLPLLEREVVPTGWVAREDFLAGYGAAQAVPGPLFTFAAYLGAMQGGVAGAALATAAIFLPAFLLILGALPFWNALRANPGIQGALVGVNAAVVGILLGALYHPLWTSAILAPMDFALGAILFVVLTIWKLPPWVVVVAGALGGAVMQMAGL